VLPPGDWDNHDLLPLHFLQAKSKAIRIRRLKKQFSFVKELHNAESFADAPSFLAKAQGGEEAGGTTGTTSGGGPSGDPEGHHHFDPFKRTGRPFGGLIDDIRTSAPYYISDFKDALNFRCFSAIVFMYFTSIGLIITFAGLMGKRNILKNQDIL
jgi:hypothetical protein